jgi:hypothetical protein
MLYKLYFIGYWIICNTLNFCLLHYLQHILSFQIFSWVETFTFLCRIPSTDEVVIEISEAGEEVTTAFTYACTYDRKVA